MKLIFKKQFNRPPIKLLKHDNTFSLITKSSIQYTHPNKLTKLDITPTNFLRLNNYFYYLSKNKLYKYKDLTITHIPRPGKIYNIINNGDDQVNILITDKKISKLSSESERVVEQFYGPKVYITNINVLGDNILTTSFGSKDIYLFNGTKHHVFVAPEECGDCILIDSDNFVVCGAEKLYYFNIEKKKPVKCVDVIGGVDIIRMGAERFYIGCGNGSVCAVVDGDIKRLGINLDGYINDIIEVNNTLVIASGKERRDGRRGVKKEAKNMVTIYQM